MKEKKFLHLLKEFALNETAFRCQRCNINFLKENFAFLFSFKNRNEQEAQYVDYALYALAYPIVAKVFLSSPLPQYEVLDLLNTVYLKTNLFNNFKLEPPLSGETTEDWHHKNYLKFCGYIKKVAYTQLKEIAQGSKEEYWQKKLLRDLPLIIKRDKRLLWEEKIYFLSSNSSSTNLQLKELKNVIYTKLYLFKILAKLVTPVGISLKEILAQLQASLFLHPYKNPLEEQFIHSVLTNARTIKDNNVISVFTRVESDIWKLAFPSIKEQYPLSYYQKKLLENLNYSFLTSEEQEEINKFIETQEYHTVNKSLLSTLLSSLLWTDLISNCFSLLGRTSLTSKELVQIIGYLLELEMVIILDLEEIERGSEEHYYNQFLFLYDIIKLLSNLHGLQVAILILSLVFAKAEKQADLTEIKTSINLIYSFLEEGGKAKEKELLKIRTYFIEIFGGSSGEELFKITLDSIYNNYKGEEITPQRIKNLLNKAKRRLMELYLNETFMPP